MLRYLLVVLVFGCVTQTSSQAQSQNASSVSRQNNWVHLKQQMSIYTSLSVDKVPLDRVVDALQARHGMSIIIDTASLEDVGWDEKVLVSVDIKNTPLASLLDAMLRPFQLTWSFRHNSITITTEDEERSHIVARVYPIPDLLVKVKLPNGEHSDNYDTIIDMLVSTVVFDSWAENGTGDAEIQAFPAANALVISQSARVHLEIEQLLADLRQARVAQKLTVYQADLGEQTMSLDKFQARRLRTYIRPTGQWRMPRSYSSQ